MTAGFARFEDVHAMLWSAAAEAARSRADLFVCLGDVVDPDRGRAHDAAAAVIRVASFLAGNDVPQLWLTGNHDVLEDGSGTSTLEPLAAHLEALEERAATRSVEGLALDVGAVVKEPRGFFVPSHRHIAIVCLPYVARSHAYDPVAFIGENSRAPGASKVLVFGHLMLPGITAGSEATDMARGRDVDYPIDAIVARWGSRALMFNGHVHERQVFRGVQVVGSAERLTFGEERNEPGYLVIEVG